MDQITQVTFNVEIKFQHDEKWYYHSQRPSLDHAIKVAEKLSNGREVRIRRVTKTIEWKNGKLYGQSTARSQTKET